jgi:hypothetical protein
MSSSAVTTDHVEPTHPEKEGVETATPANGDANHSVADEKKDAMVPEQASLNDSHESVTRQKTKGTTHTVDENDENIDYPSGPKLAFILFGLALAVFLVALDQTIIATAIPKITDQFNSLQDIGLCFLMTASS